MYPSYSDSPQHIETCMRSVEGDQGHLRMTKGSVTLNLTANTQLNNNVSFSLIYSPNTTPYVYPSLASVGVISAKINVVASGATNAGFTLQSYSDTTQTITVNWFAIGSAQ